MGSIWKMITGAASGYLNYIMIGGAVVLVTVAGIFYWQWSVEAARAETLKLEVDRQASVIDGLNQTVKLKNNAIEALESTNKTLTEKTKIESEIQTEITNAPDSEDGDVAPVLDRALRGISRLRQGPHRAD